MTRRLHLGCGKVFLQGFINMDVVRHGAVDVLGDATILPFSDSVFDLVYASHILEHFSFRRTAEILGEWKRVIRPGGKLRISVPDFEALTAIYADCNDLEVILGPLMGTGPVRSNLYNDFEETTDRHLACFDRLLLTRFLETAGFVAVHPWDFRRVDHGNAWDYSQAETLGRLISLNIEARKPLDEIVRDE